MLNYILIYDKIASIVKSSGFVPRDLNDLEALAQAQRDGHSHKMALWFSRDVDVEGDQVSQSIKIDAEGMAYLQASHCGGDLRSMRIQQDAMGEALDFMHSLQDLPGKLVEGYPVLTKAQKSLLGEVFVASVSATFPLRVSEESPGTAEELEELGTVQLCVGGSSRNGDGYRYLKLTSFGHLMWIRS